MLDKSKVKPLGNNILVKELEIVDEQIRDGIYIPDTAAAVEKPEEVKVISIGPGMRGPDGKRIPTEIKVGAKLLISKGGGLSIGDGYSIVATNDILAVI